ncbi:MAG: polysaccharide pyruvyl transferase family protein [Alphaproteobacteria bacterium]|nr:polysaccharide pyruvyl transferase family protein [Alphaproteobacteria bacterium]
MKITIIGWYGTETIGDRAILAGLFHLFAESYGEFEIYLGCLDTLLSERTIDEDNTFFSECANGKLMSIKLFDSRKKSELDAAIAWCNILIIGGGPLMEIEPMHMLLYAFMEAKKRQKKCVVAGCGMGPFKTEKYINIATRLIALSDITIFRDNKSQVVYNTYSKQQKDTEALIDPAAIAAFCFLNSQKAKKEGNYMAINFLEPPVQEYDGLSELNIDYFVSIVRIVANNYTGDIRLVPMHSFEIGGDDRMFLNKVARLADISRVTVHNRPLSLEETMNSYYGAEFCVGMRFHSVLLQTIINGKNFVLDYTDPKNGKIANLLKQLSLFELFDKRYVSLVNKPNVIPFDFSKIDKVVVSDQQIVSLKNNYIQTFKTIF